MLTNNANYANNSFLYNYNGLNSLAMRSNNTESNKSEQDSASFSQILESATSETKTETEAIMRSNQSETIEQNGQTRLGWADDFLQDMENQGLGDLGREMLAEAKRTGRERELLLSHSRSIIHRIIDEVSKYTNADPFSEEFNRAWASKEIDEIMKIPMGKDKMLKHLNNLFYNKPLSDDATRQTQINSFYDDMLNIIQGYKVNA